MNSLLLICLLSWIVNGAKHEKLGTSSVGVSTRLQIVAGREQELQRAKLNESAMPGTPCSFLRGRRPLCVKRVIIGRFFLWNFCSCSFKICESLLLQYCHSSICDGLNTSEDLGPSDIKKKNVGDSERMSMGLTLWQVKFFMALQCANPGFSSSAKVFQR